MQLFRVPRLHLAARDLEAVAAVTAPKDTPAEEVVVAVRVSEAAEEASAVKAEVPAARVGPQVDRDAEASASFSAKRKSAASASSAWISLTTKKSKCSSPSCRSAEKFFRAA
jgi:hypothetical protein